MRKILNCMRSVRGKPRAHRMSHMIKTIVQNHGVKEYFTVLQLIRKNIKSVLQNCIIGFRFMIITDRKDGKNILVTIWLHLHDAVHSDDICCVCDVNIYVSDINMGIIQDKLSFGETSTFQSV